MRRCGKCNKKFEKGKDLAEHLMICAPKHLGDKTMAAVSREKYVEIGKKLFNDYKPKGAMREGKVKKGGVNEPPTTPKPNISPPGQEGKHRNVDNYKPFSVNEKDYIGHELARKLYEGKCRIESGWCWVKRKDYNWYLMPSKIAYETSAYEVYPAYHYYEIIKSNARGFFGSNYPKESKLILDILQGHTSATADNYIWQFTVFNPMHVSL